MSQGSPVSMRKANAADHAAAPGVMVFLTKPSLGISKIFDPTERLSVLSSAASIPDPCWSLRSFIDWQACCGDFGVPARSNEIQSGLLPAPRRAPSSGPTQLAMLQTLTQINSSKGPGSNGRDDPLASDQEPLSTTSKRPPFGPLSKSRGMAQCFLRLSNLDPTLLDRVGSYEARLWRQAAQTIWTLEMMRQPPSPMRQRLRHRIAPFTWDREGRSRLTSESRN
jgi:hypothetical protein